MIPAATRNQMRSGAIVAWTAMLGLWSSCAADPVELKTFQAIPRPLPTATLQYGTTATQVIDIFLPKTEGSHPLVILIHGGCWSVTTAGREQLRHLGEELARKNMAVWSIGYRRANEPGGGYPGTFQDVAAAIDLAASEAARYKLDLTRTVSAGHSAGGHLALWAAGRHQLSPNSPLFTPHPFVPRSVISLGGVGDVEAFAPLIPIICGPGIVERLAPPPALAAAYAEISPALLPPAARRVVMISGILDRLVPPYVAHDYERAMRQKVASPVELVNIPDAGHFDLVTPGTAAWKEVSARIESALLNPP